MILGVRLTREHGGADAALRGVRVSAVPATGEPLKVCE